MGNFKLVCPCLLGVEGLVAEELRRMDAENVEPQNGRVFFEGSQELIARANLSSRYSERVLILMGNFRALSFEELFQSVKALPWEQFIGKQDRFPVKGRSLDSKLASVPDCQSIIKKAIVERLKQHYRIPWFEETGRLYQIQFLSLKDTVSVMIDTCLLYTSQHPPQRVGNISLRSNAAYPKGGIILYRVHVINQVGFSAITHVFKGLVLQ